MSGASGSTHIDFFLGIMLKVMYTAALCFVSVFVVVMICKKAYSLYCVYNRVESSKSEGGLKLCQIEQLKSSVYNGSTHSTCAICLTDFEQNEGVVILPSCQHTFHRKCLNEWLLRKTACPLCKNVVDLPNCPNKAKCYLFFSIYKFHGESNGRNHSISEDLSNV
mmetsp:Transcript_7464/g.11159  ORF Transcript_7464/g.11159 Transcript_7464/m.11159 type:complete len:165 (-) Transcript_7464:137-631(-)